MPTITQRLTIPTANYVAVSAGEMNVFIRLTGATAVRVHVGQTLPAAGTGDYLPLITGSLSLADLEGGDNVYLLAEAAGAEVVVIKGG